MIQLTNRFEAFIENWKLKIKNLNNDILDILFPKLCISCGREGAYICKDCEIFLSEVDMFGAELRTKIMSVWEYEGLIEKLILKIKYNGCYDIIGELVDKAFEKIKLDLPENTIITFVPMYKKREKRRGFNQAELIAEKIGEHTGKPVIKLLKKTKDNHSQVGLNPQERAENVKGAFKMFGAELRTIKTPSILIVDDVYTTGATMGECMKTLKENGFKNIWGFTLSRKMNIQNC